MYINYKVIRDTRRPPPPHYFHIQNWKFAHSGRHLYDYTLSCVANATPAWSILIVKMTNYTGWPRKNATLTINNFKKTRDRMKKLCAILRIQFFPQQDDTKIVNFDEGVLILWPFFFKAMSFLRFVLLSQKSQFTYRKFSIVWLPRVECLLLLCKAKPAWVTRSIHYVILQHYNPGELLQEIPPFLKRAFWYKRCKFWKWHCLRKKALESKRLHQNH